MARHGKYHIWLEKDKLTLLEGWARSGLSDEQIARNIGISTVTYYDWIKKHPNISKAIKKGKEVSDFEVENALFKSALGYEYEEVKTYIEENRGGKKKRVEKVKKHVAPNVAAQIFWLKNRKRDIWNNYEIVDVKKKEMEIKQLEQELVIDEDVKVSGFTFDRGAADEKRS